MLLSSATAIFLLTSSASLCQPGDEDPPTPPSEGAEASGASEPVAPPGDASVEVQENGKEDAPSVSPSEGVPEPPRPSAVEQTVPSSAKAEEPGAPASEPEQVDTEVGAPSSDEREPTPIAGEGSALSLPLDRDDEDQAEWERHGKLASSESLRARRWIRGGIAALSTGAALGIAAIVLASSDPCEDRWTGNSCFDSAKRRASLTVAIPAIALLSGGGTMLGVGLKQRGGIGSAEQYPLSGLTLSVSGRF